MPALHRRQSPVDIRKAAQKPTGERLPYPMVMTHSQSSSDDDMDQPLKFEIDVDDEHQVDAEVQAT